MSLNETTVNAHRIRFARLIDVLLADAAIEPQYQPSRSREWLAWAHGARWHLVRRWRVPIELLLTATIACRTGVVLPCHRCRTR